MKDLFIYPYQAGSKSAIALSEALDCYRINRDGSSRFQYGPNKVVINWGMGNALPAEVMRCPVLNKPEAVSRAINKITSFERFIANRVRTPQFTRDRQTASQWLTNGATVYCRLTSEGSDGQGLKVVQPNVEARSTSDHPPLPSAQFYTKGIRIANEYRVNVLGSEVLTYQKKVRRTDVTTHNELVRTTDGGWGFDVVEEQHVPPTIDGEAIAAVAALGLDFGGVDIVEDIARNVYVLEVNTAPHLTPYSAEKFASAIKEFVNT